MYHLDFYRLNSEEELYFLELERYLYSDGITIVEWPEIIADLLDPERTIFIRIGFSQETGERRFLIESPVQLDIDHFPEEKVVKKGFI